MKKLLVVLVVMLFAGFAIMISCAETEKKADTETTEEVATEMTEEGTVEETAGEVAEKVEMTFDELKGAFVAKVTPAISDWNAKITEIETRKNNLPDLAQAPFEKPMTELIEKRDLVGEQFTKVENATEETFDTEKTALEGSLGELDGLFDTVSSLFK